jgi:hypothetical protein
MIDPATNLPVSDTNGSHPDLVQRELEQEKIGPGATCPARPIAASYAPQVPGEKRS